MPPETQLFLLRLIHTVIFGVEVIAIGYIVWRGVRGGIDLWLALSVLLTLGTGLGLLLNHGDCIFHTWAVAVSGEENVSDIFLPSAVAQAITPVSTPIVSVGYALILWRLFRLKPPTHG